MTTTEILLFAAGMLIGAVAFGLPLYLNCRELARERRLIAAQYAAACDTFAHERHRLLRTIQTASATIKILRKHHDKP